MQKYYYELKVELASHYALYRDFLRDVVPLGFEELQNGFLVRSEEDLEDIIWALERFSEALEESLDVSIKRSFTQRKLQNRDWVDLYQKSIEAITIDSFHIHPSWSEPQEGLINISIDPALAFGTGHHPTTASCIRAIAKYVKQTDNCLDVGCGSGILSMVAMRLGAEVDACDTDEVCVQNSCKNAETNQLSYRKIWQGSCTQVEREYDVVVANIVADVLTFIANDVKSLVKNEGIVILSGILDKYETKVLSYYKDLTLLERIPQDEWVTLVLQKK